MRFVRFLMIGVAIFLEGVLAGCGGARQAAVNVQTAEGGSPANVLVSGAAGSGYSGETYASGGDSVRAKADSWGGALVAVCACGFCLGSQCDVD